MTSVSDSRLSGLIHASVLGCRAWSCVHYKLAMPAVCAGWHTGGDWMEVGARRCVHYKLMMPTVCAGWHTGGDWVEAGARWCLSAAAAYQAPRGTDWIRNSDPLCCLCSHRWELLRGLVFSCVPSFLHRFGNFRRGSSRLSQLQIQPTCQYWQGQGNGERRHSVSHTHSEWTTGACEYVPVPWQHQDTDRTPCGRVSQNDKR